VHRAAGVLAEWDAKVARPVLRSAAEVRRDETIATLSARLREATQQITQLQGKLDALASVTASLYHENQQMRRQLGGRHVTTIAALPAAD
jgi:TolA-binding protein